MWKPSIQFQLQDLLGEGSQGCVFKALRVDRETGMQQAVAVKILHSKTAVDLWKKEFDSLSRVRSPYCVSVLSFERIEGRPALVLELVDGISLNDLGSTCLLTPALIEEIIAQIQIGLEDLRAQGTVHGDLSPNNVMIDESGRIRLLDFGLANCEHRLTPDFASPERLTGTAPDFAADLFSLGRIEQFLRGVKLSSTQPSPYLYTIASLRHVRDIQTQPPRQAMLAATIQELRARRRVRQHTRTVGPFTVGRSSKGWILSVLACAWVFATSGASQAIQLASGFVSLRTQNWHYFLVDGTPVGYAPITVQLKAGKTHRLEWISSQGRGSRELSLKRDEHLIFADHDLTH